MQVVLVMFRADGERRSFSLPRAVTVIGRREDCDLRIPLGDVSRKHCRFIVDGDDLKLEDLGSSNGTYHNGVRIQEAFVQPGDTVQIGPVQFVVQIDGVPADDEIQPAAAAPAAADDTSVGGEPVASGDSVTELDEEDDVVGGPAGDDVVDLALEEIDDQPNNSDDQDQQRTR